MPYDFPAVGMLLRYIFQYYVRLAAVERNLFIVLLFANGNYNQTRWMLAIGENKCRVSKLRISCKETR